MKRMLWLVVPALFLAGCPANPPPVPAPHPPVDTDWCGKMCAHLKELGCEEGEPVYNSDIKGEPGKPNQSCADHCVELQDKGFPINPRCVSFVKSCEDIEPSRQKDPKECGSEKP